MKLPHEPLNSLVVKSIPLLPHDTGDTTIAITPFVLMKDALDSALFRGIPVRLRFLLAMIVKSTAGKRGCSQ